MASGFYFGDATELREPSWTYILILSQYRVFHETHSARRLPCLRSLSLRRTALQVPSQVAVQVGAVGRQQEVVQVGRALPILHTCQQCLAMPQEE